MSLKVHPRRPPQWDTAALVTGVPCLLLTGIVCLCCCLSGSHAPERHPYVWTVPFQGTPQTVTLPGALVATCDLRAEWKERHMAGKSLG